MRIPKITSITLVLIALSALILGGCKEDPNNPEPNKGTQCKVTVQLGLDKEVELAKLMLTVTDSRTLKKSETEVDKKSRTVEITLDKGTYSFAVSGETVDHRTLVGAKENVVVSDAMTLSIPVQIGEAPTPEKSQLIFGDIFFNGETNARMMHPDQYFMIVNNGEKTEYLDGICYAVTAHGNPMPETPWTKYLADKGELPVAGIYQFPGSGKEYPIKPGEFKIVAATAINHHTEDKPNSVDLSGADFEFLFPDVELPGRNGKIIKITDTDNPDVPNMNIIVDCFSSTGIAHPRGFWPPLLFKVEGDLSAFLKDHVMQVTNKKGETENFYTIPVDLILDGVETGCEGQFTTRALPITVDKGNFYVTGCHQQELAHRKTEMRNGRTYWIDTNDSTNDYERVQGQNAYPKK